jgi:hypothetical protein
MNLEELVENKDSYSEQWIIWEQGTFIVLTDIPRKKRKNRETLARLFEACVHQIQKKSPISSEHASRIARSLWIEEANVKRPKTLPRVVAEDGFLRMYALGRPCSLDLIQRIWRRTAEPVEDKTINLEPITIEWNHPEIRFYDVDATPPGVLPKFIPYFRLKKDKELLQKIEKDFKQVSAFEDSAKRLFLSLAILSHGAAYRELDGVQINVPSFTEKNRLITYQCKQHLVGGGLKTVSMIPIKERDAKCIYLCQGTEFWPSQPSMLGSIIANFGEHGSATEAYAHSWRLIHQHLRALGNPLVAGHSMGGALAIQIGLYSHHLIDSVYAFNPPMPNERDYVFFQNLSEETQKILHVFANLDDFAFWRIGSKVIGNVTLFLGKRRWKYYTVSLSDCLLFLPAFVKFIRNVHHAFPAHQRIAALYDNWVSVKLTPEEIEKENTERTSRFDYLHFLPKLYDPLTAFMSCVRKMFKWRLESEYLKNEIEIITLHERDLIDTLTEENRLEIEKALETLHEQKKGLQERLFRFKK